MNRRRITVALGTTVLGLTAACTGGGGNVTLHGTFTDTAKTGGPAGACADQLGRDAVTASVANVAEGSGPVNWKGNPVVTGKSFSGASVYGCAGTWSVTVPAAQIGY